MPTGKPGSGTSRGLRFLTRCQAYDAEQVAQRHGRRVGILLDAIATLHRSGIYPSRNQLQKLLPREIHFLHDYIAAAWGNPSGLRRVKGRPIPEPQLASDGATAKAPGVNRDGG